MTNEEAIKLISEHFMAQFHAWLDDYYDANITDSEFGFKYGFCRNENSKPKANLKYVAWFVNHIYNIPFKSLGIDQHKVIELHREGFLSRWWEWRYRTDHFFLSQETAKAIFRKYKQA